MKESDLESDQEENKIEMIDNNGEKMEGSLELNKIDLRAIVR